MTMRSSFLSLKGSNMSAQGNALGIGNQQRPQALKGRNKYRSRNKLYRPFRA